MHLFSRLGRTELVGTTVSRRLGQIVLVVLIILLLLLLLLLEGRSVLLDDVSVATMRTFP